jgi:hypothetical protein
VSDRTPIELDVGGIEIATSVPANAVVTGCIMYVQYQYIDEDGDSCSGMVWSQSRMSSINAMGMAYAGFQAVKRNMK